MQMFGPTLVRQAVWMVLRGELIVPIKSSSTHQVALDIVTLLRAMGCEPQSFPSDAALEDWAPADAGTALRKLKKKLRRQVVVRQAFMPAEPSQILFPQTPVKANETVQEVCIGSPYMHDSHMETTWSVLSERPTSTGAKPSRQDRRYDLNEDSSYEGDDLLDVDCLEGDLTEEWARQIHELSARKAKNSTSRLEMASLETSNSSPAIEIRWLRIFIYEMKGTHTPSNDWCMTFELGLQDGALNFYRQLPRKTRHTWKLLSDAFIKYYCSKFDQSAKARYYSANREDKDHLCVYLNRFNGYARNVGVQFENGGRESMNHVEHFPDTCDDRGLEECLCHVRVKDIHDLDDIINDVLKRRDRKTKRETSVRRSHSHDNGRRRDSGRNEDSISVYRRGNHHRDDRRRDASPSRPRVTLADALSDLVIALNETSVGLNTSQSGQYDHGYETNEDSLGDEKTAMMTTTTPMRRRTNMNAARLQKGRLLGLTTVEPRVMVTSANDKNDTRDNRNGRQ
ncbi:hypothetical protein PHMEG_0006015 [Phytophthora megakarya]|uniref:Retrotransposon gag domain-containing protein n=1 Tax=Phytophthora megakarya TaxID=4795 RepID=A0A225WPW8_9STRA|nr:hypothetical protein PHMEG_0006015 [Phytophthora megakarya]